MKKYWLTHWVLWIVLTGTYAQEKTQYLVNGKSAIKGFGGLLTEFSEIKSMVAVSSGGGGGILINQTVFVGGYGMSTATERHMDIPGYTNLHLSLGHGGLWLGYLYRSSRLIHAGFNTRLGWGAISLNQHNIGNGTPNNTISTDHIFAITPEVKAELNVTRWFKINVGGGYRWVMGLDEAYYSTNHFNSLTGTVGLLFGGFSSQQP